jgi:hypothetical protein
MSFFEPRKNRSCRNDIRAEARRRQPTPRSTLAAALRAEKAMLVLAIAVIFIILASAILMLRPRVVAWRPGQTPRADVVSRVDFTVADEQQLQRARESARDAEPRVYAPAPADPLAALEAQLIALPERVRGMSLEQLDLPLRDILDGPSLASLQDKQDDPTWAEAVRKYVTAIRQMNLVLIPAADQMQDRRRSIRLAGERGRVIEGADALSPLTSFNDLKPAGPAVAAARQTMRDELERKLGPASVDAFSTIVNTEMLEYTLAVLDPTHLLDEAATANARAEAADRVPPSAGYVSYKQNQVLIPAGKMIGVADWQLLREENASFRRARLGRAVWAERVGLAGCVLMMTAALGLYIRRYQPRIIQNPVRAVGLSALILGALLVAQLAGLGSANLTLLGIAPLMLVAMTLCVAYDGRFALGVCGILSIFVTLALGQGIGFFLIAFAGLVTCSALLMEVRSRSKLIEVGGACALALGGSTIIVGMLKMDPAGYTLVQAAYAALAGLGSGFVVLGVLPFIERVFHITTGMTLLEYQDHPLLRRLALEAPGTYNHSLQVASISEEAANAIGADALLCRVASYYHDIGKLRKPDYFIENQVDGGNRHLNLNPNMSLLVIVGHVKDGVEMAKEYKLPRAFVPIIQQHHGTTLVEYFYREACQRQQEKLAAGDLDACKPVEDCDYRYPGPRPRSREAAIVMMADTCESACRAMTEPTPGRIEGRVNDLFQKRLLDGQFDDSPITLRELDGVRRSVVKSLVGIYHGRIAYQTDTDHAIPATAAPAALEKVG